MKALVRQRQALKSAAASIAHLSFVERVLHPKSRKPIVASAIGIVIMLVASATSVEAHVIQASTGTPHVVIDAAAYFFHGVGAIPLVRYFEFLWALLIVSE